MNTIDIALHHQRLVEQIQRLRTELDRAAEQLAGDTRTARLRSAVAEARARRGELERRLQEVDRDTENRRRRVDERERELMSGHLGSPTGLIRLREEVDHLKDGLRGAEDAELALLEDADRDDSELGSLERALEERTMDAARATPELERRRSDTTARLEVVEAEARSTWEQLPADWQEAIGRIRAQHADAVAEVRDGQCQGCHLAVTSSLLQTLRHGGMVTCDNCGRLLAG